MNTTITTSRGEIKAALVRQGLRASTLKRYFLASALFLPILYFLVSNIPIVIFTHVARTLVYTEHEITFDIHGMKVRDCQPQFETLTGYGKFPNGWRTVNLKLRAVNMDGDLLDHGLKVKPKLISSHQAFGRWMFTTRPVTGDRASDMTEVSAIRGSLLHNCGGQLRVTTFGDYGRGTIVAKLGEESWDTGEGPVPTPPKERTSVDANSNRKRAA